MASRSQGDRRQIFPQLVPVCCSCVDRKSVVYWTDVTDQCLESARQAETGI